MRGSDGFLAEIEKKGVEDMMKKDSEPKKKKGMQLVVTFGSVALVAVLALGVGMLQPEKGKNPGRIDLNATPTPGLPKPTETAKRDTERREEQAPTKAPDKEQVTVKPTEQPKQESPQTPVKTAEVPQQAEEAGTPVNNPDGVIKGLNFSAETGMIWPVTGEALIPYSPDHAIYHKTLDSYRTSNYVLLAGTVGSHVSAAADGVVTSVKEELKTGTTVTMRVSEDHEIVYGMLSGVTVSEGDFVDAGTVFACVGEPTRYYVEEGSGVYLQVLENGETKNPMLFLRESSSLEQNQK